MGQLRRKVHNYTILVLIKEGSMPDFHVKSLAALRVREGEEVDSLCFQDCDKKERQAIAKDMKALHAFLADDLILTADSIQILSLSIQNHHDRLLAQAGLCADGGAQPA